MATSPSLACVRRKLSAAAACLALITAPAMLLADGGSNDRPPTSEYSLAKQAIEDGDYEVAIDKLTKLHEADADDADVLNLLGYTYRRIGNFDQSRGYYLQALAIDPDHRGANAYLGELYLETGELGKAEERLEVLDADCWLGCSEYTELKESIAKYKAENGIQ